MKKKLDENGRSYVDLPDAYARRELCRLYRAIPLKDATSRILRKYFNAMGNLYGVVPLQKARDIVFSLDPKLVTEEEFWAFVEIAVHEDADYTIIGDDALYEDGEACGTREKRIMALSVVLGDEVEKTEELQKGKPYYRPAKEELLKYNDPCYYEPTPEAEAMRAYLLRRCQGDEDKVDAILKMMVLTERSVTAEPRELIDMLEDFDIVFSSKEECDRFLSVYNGFHDATRMPCNRGFTPEEISEKLYQSDNAAPTLLSEETIREGLRNGEITKEQAREKILSADFPSEAVRIAWLKKLDAYAPAPDAKKEKVGRNDLCPCGSGKKYKHCCGK